MGSLQRKLVECHPTEFGQIRLRCALIHSEPPPANIWASLDYACLILGKILFLTGIVLLAWFAYLNAPFHLRG